MTTAWIQREASGAPLRSDELEGLLRRFRADELAHRQRPSPMRVAVDMLSRVVPQLAGYVGMLVLASPYHLLAAVVFGVATVSLVGSWFHDGVHGIVPAPAALTALLRRFASAPVALSPRWWPFKHVRLHHRYPGNPAFDPDIQFTYVARVSAAQIWRPWHATQHLHMWLLYPFTTLNMLKPTEASLARRYSALLGLRTPARSWVFLVDKYLPFAFVWAPVFVLLPFAAAVGAFFTFFVTTGILGGLITQIQHNTALADTSVDESEQWPLCEQVMRTTDVGTSCTVWWWLCGGTNYHVVHHIAPSLTFLELPAATARLRANLREIGLELPTHAGVAAAICSHAALLRQLGRPRRPDSARSAARAS